jgi:hypothetical protein
MTALLILPAACTSVHHSPHAHGGAVAPTPDAMNRIFVNPKASADGTGSSAAPLRTIQAALDRAGPGAVIHLEAGTYPAGGSTRHDGTANHPITIVGPAAGEDPTMATPAGSPTATVYGSGHVLNISNSYYRVEGFTINGQPALAGRIPAARWPAGSATAAQRFKVASASVVVNSRLIYIDGGAHRRGVVGTSVYRMTLTGAGGECLRVRSNAAQTSIIDSRIQWCGMFPVPQADGDDYHNGEGVYIGTSPKTVSLANHLDDRTSGTYVSADLIQTFGTECLDVKENSFGNVLTKSVCENNAEPTADYGSNLELRGWRNRITDNTIRASAGFGVKLESDRPGEDLGQNVITGNTLSGQAGAPLFDRSTAHQGPMCDNHTTYPSQARYFLPCPGS